MTLGPKGLTDPQAALKLEYRADRSGFVRIDQAKARYGKSFPKLWLRDFYRELGVPVVAKPPADALKLAGLALHEKVQREGSAVALFAFNANFGLRVIVDRRFPFGSTRFQPGFHLSCMVFGWLDDTNGHVRRDLGVAKHHFYDLEKRYPIGTTTEVGPGVVVEAFRHGVT